MSKNTFQHKNHLKVKVERLEEKQGVLKTEDGQSLFVSLDLLPENLVEGDFVSLTLSSCREVKEDQESLAKDILNEILKKDD